MDKKYISVWTLNKYIKAKMDQDVSLQNVYIKGEISNYRPHPSGHLYFTLKDENSKISAIMFASLAKRLTFRLENGMQVFIKARVSVYEVSGEYQLYVQSIQQDGIGQLYTQFEALKKKLENEGLFDEKHKKEIPSFPRRIAVLTAKNGDALHDVMQTIRIRFPCVKVVIFPIPVQGKNAYLQIIEMLEYVDTIGFDTIILARGGGDIEQLWNFNEEALARCIFRCQTPIISGVGHETNFTICDFVSDYRAATPTFAAIKATPDRSELMQHLKYLQKQLCYKMNQYLTIKKQELSILKNSHFLTTPESLYSHEILHLTHLQDQLSYQFQVFDLKIYQQLTQYQQSLKQKMTQRLQQENYHVHHIMSQLDALSPLKVMQRGYSLIKKDDQVMKSKDDVQSGDQVYIQFFDGIKEAEIK